MVDFPKVKKSDLRSGEREDVATHQNLIVRSRIHFLVVVLS